MGGVGGGRHIAQRPAVPVTTAGGGWGGLSPSPRRQSCARGVGGGTAPHQHRGDLHPMEEGGERRRKENDVRFLLLLLFLLPAPPSPSESPRGGGFGAGCGRATVPMCPNIAVPRYLRPRPPRGHQPTAGTLPYVGTRDPQHPPLPPGTSRRSVPILRPNGTAVAHGWCWSRVGPSGAGNHQEMPWGAWAVRGKCRCVCMDRAPNMAMEIQYGPLGSSVSHWASVCSTGLQYNLLGSSVDCEAASWPTGL